MATPTTTSNTAPNVEELVNALRSRAIEGDLTNGEASLLSRYDPDAYSNYLNRKQNSTTTTAERTDKTSAKQSSHSHNLSVQTSTSSQKSESKGKSESVSGRRIAGLEYDEDGNPTEESLAARRNERENLIRKAFITDAFGMSDAKRKAMNEAELKRIEREAKLREFVNSANVLSGIVTAAAGGNVYKTQADNSDMNEKARQQRSLMAAEEAAIAQRNAKMQMDYAKAILEGRQADDQLLAQNVQRSNQSNESNAKTSGSQRTNATQDTNTTSNGTNTVGKGTQTTTYGNSNNGYNGIVTDERDDD